MSTDTTSAAALPSNESVAVDAAVASPVASQGQSDEPIHCAKQPLPAFLHSPPDSNNAAKSDASDSELSDLDEEPILDHLPVLLEAPTERVAPVEPKSEPAPEIEDDLGEILPDHWSGAVAVFRPTMHQFKNFDRFMDKVDSYGMKSGVIKIIPPEEWRASQPDLDDLVKQIKVREPIKQDIMGSNGTYRQVNLLHGRSYNLPQWRQLCEQSEHQPPARRGERRANAEKPKAPRPRPVAAKVSDAATPKKRGRGRPGKGRGRPKKAADNERPMTPVSPKPEVEPEADTTDVKEEPLNSIETNLAMEEDEEPSPRPVGRMGAIKPAKTKTQSTSARRKYSRREGSVMIDEAAFKDFDYRMDISEYTPERCEELERAYWKTLTYAPPLYGADMMGTLFDDRTETWNLNKLPNILDVLGSKIPGVNTAYLYLGMWKATFAWHLEDVDLYSINYLHFGAPKQWYSISQADARKFEAAMKTIWPTDAKACDQFLRHKAFLISPQHLKQHFGITVNKVVSYPGEFVVTYPYGYHSGYNLGYNCAEAVNFGLERWLEMGKIAKKCECAQAQDSVWINVHEIERKLRGEETEYEETEEEEEEEEEEDDDMAGLPTPPSHGIKFKVASRKRKRGPGDKVKIKVKKIKLRIKSKSEPPCCLCPHNLDSLDLLPTDDGRKAHRTCALYIPETYIDLVDGKEVVYNTTSIPKDRLDLKCLFCRSKRGACFQCSHKKCARAYHATCAAAAGVFTEEQDVPVFGEDGTEYKEQAFEFTCRFHRSKRDKKIDIDALEADSRIEEAARCLKKGDICQFQYLKGDIFAGMVADNRDDERMLLIDVMPNGDRMEVDWKWLLLPDPSDYRLPKASATAIPMPKSRKAKEKLNAKRAHDDKPRKDDVFSEGYTWAEFHTSDASNKEQVKIDFGKSDQIWFYLGKTSTDAKAQYTEDLAQPRHNAKGNYLDTIPKPPKPPKPTPAARPTTTYQRPAGFATNYTYPYTGMSFLPALGASTAERPYVYKPKPVATQFDTTRIYTPQNFAPGYFARSFEHTVAPVSHIPVVSHPIQGALPQPLAYGVAPVAHKAPLLQPPTYSKPTWQVHSSVYQKYPFFQVNHNRDVAKYRTPYSPCGGFTNGYQGDIKAHLLAGQTSLTRLPHTSAPPTIQHDQSHAYLGAHTAASPQVSRPFSQPPTLPGSTSAIPSAISTPQPPAVVGVHNSQHHPAIKAQYLIGTQYSPQGRAKPTPAPKSYKVGLSAAVNLSLQSTKSTTQVPPKQSPVPLPANFLAALTSSPSTPASATRPSPLQASSTPTVPASTPITAPLSMTASSEDFKRSPLATISVTPVPVPFLPSLSATKINVNATTTALADGDSVAGGSLQLAANTSPLTTVVQKELPTEPQAQQEFPDLPGGESMEFVERMMNNLRRASLHEPTS